MATAATPHVHLDPAGVAWIDDTNVKVIEVALDRTARGWSPEEIHFQYPHLSLAQVYAALAYYYDHQTELDTDIERRLQTVEALASQSSFDPVRDRLRAAGRLP